MSYTITTDVFCDGKGCSLWTEGTSSHRIERKQASECARQVGWLVKKRKHYCPRCKEKVPGGCLGEVSR